MSPELVAGAQVDSGVVLWVALAVLPLLLVACTAFTKLSVVLAALRVGMGAETLLPTGLMLALALVLTVVAMGPTGLAIVDAIDAGGGMEAMLALGGEAAAGAWAGALQPLLEFMRSHAHAPELEFFSGLSGATTADPRVLVPAFMISELAEALTLCVLLLVPFVLVDLVVAQVLVLLELGNVQARLIALPAKILLFLAAGGWDLLIGSIVGGYLV